MYNHSIYRFDIDRSGTIDCNELHQAFTTFGYRLWVHLKAVPFMFLSCKTNLVFILQMMFSHKQNLAIDF